MAFDLGGTVPLTYAALDPATGFPVTPSTVVLRITQPDATVVTPTFETPATGSYVCYFVPTQSGRHGVEWNSVGPATDYTDSFDVNPSAPRYMVSLASMKKQLNIADANTQFDAEVLEYIAAATDACERVRSEAMVTRIIVAEEHEVTTGGRLTLNWSPVQSVSDVRTIDNFITWDPTRLHLDSANGVLSTTWLSGLYDLWGRIQVTYTAGYTVIPAAYQLATKIIVQHLWMTKRGAGNTPQPGGFEQDAMVSGMAFAIPYRALELLGNGKPGFA